MSLSRRRLIGGFFLLLLPLTKWLQVSVVDQWHSVDIVRQVFLCVVLAIGVRLLYGSWDRALPWHTELRPRARLWTLGPALLVAAAIIALGLIIGFGNYMGGGQRLIFGGTAGRVLFTIIVIGFGEEYLFRGLLYAIAEKTGLDGGRFWLLSVSFAAWHIPDALPDGLFFVVGTMAAMFAVSYLVLYPLRRASGNILAPTLVHAINNVGLSFIAF